MTIPTLPPGSRLYGLDQNAIQHVVAAAQALEAGRVNEASDRLGGALASHRDHPEVLRLKSSIHSLRGQHGDAIRAIERAVQLRPQDAHYRNTLGTILGAAGEYDAAVAALRDACALQSNFAVAWYNLGVMLTRSVRNDEAVVALRRAVALAPDHMPARALLADMLRVGGHADEAAQQYRKVLAEQPWAGMAWWGLADLKTTRFAEGDVERIRAAMRDPRAGDDDLITMGFALAKALADEGRYAESLAALEAANAIARHRKTWDAAGFSASIAAIDAAFDPPPSPAPAALGGEVVFIVGLPRSGTTLIEQILASHSKVEGAGELADVPSVIGEESRRRGKPFPQWVGELGPADWERLGRRYLERTAHWRQQRPISIDKLPGNWIFIGAIAAMLPTARIVVCRRDPLETCLSCYRQHLDNNEYTRDFRDLGAYWRDFDRGVKHWLALYPTHIYESIYEDLVAAPEASIRNLLAFCGLEWEPGCLQFHTNTRHVRSPSATQVREPLRRDTARAWRYGALLDPLRAALGLPPFQPPAAQPDEPPRLAS